MPVSEHYDEDIEQVLIQQYRHSLKDDLNKVVCWSLTKACVGMDKAKKKKKQDEVLTNH